MTLTPFIPTFFYRTVLLLLVLAPSTQAESTNGILALQSDFGTTDHAVASMHGVARTVDKNLIIEDLTHLITPFNIWQASYRLDAAATFWPQGTVFVSVVDPGVGSARKSVVLKTRNNQYFVTPDNGTLTHIAQREGIEAVREIDESVNRLPGSENSHTFHGRDVYAYTGARLAAGVISFEQVGPKLKPEVLTIPFENPRIENNRIVGGIPVLDPNYGNIWTNISMGILLKYTGAKHIEGIYGLSFQVKIIDSGKTVHTMPISFQRSFADVEKLQPLLYINSVGNVAVALNQGSFADTHGIAAGGEWRIEITH